MIRDAASRQHINTEGIENFKPYILSLQGEAEYPLDAKASQCRIRWNMYELVYDLFMFPWNITVDSDKEHA